MIIEIVVLIIGLPTAFYIVNFLKECIRRRRLIQSLPGPKSYPIIGHLVDLLCDDAALFKKVRRWSLDYYPVYNLVAGPVPTINICSPEDFELIASTTKNMEKSFIYRLLELWLDEGLLRSTGSKWQTRRKLLTPAFHFKILQQFIIVFNNETRNLVEVLKNECHKSHLNVVPYISQFTLCTIKETSMGNSLNLKNEEDKTYFTAIHQIGKVLMYRLRRPWLYTKYPYFIFPAGMMEKKLVKTLHAFTSRVIRERSENFERLEETENEEFNYEKRKKLAMLDLLLNAKLNGLIDDKGIQDEVNTFIFEGHDTSAMSICFTLMLLASHKDVQELIVQEINHVLPDPNTPPSYSDLQELKYMERCIKESLRLYPSVPFISRTLEEDIVVSTGHTLPKSSTANVHIFDIHRNPKIWLDPERFDPDRFLLEKSVNRHPFAYVPFSAGPRNCIGQRFAVLEIKAVLCGILRNFILEPVDTPENITLIISIILRTEKGIIRVKFTPRS